MAKGANPLDPLSPTEVETAARLVKQAVKEKGVEGGTGTVLFSDISLQEPSKADYIAWKKGAPAPPRQAQVVFQVLPNPLVITCCCDCTAETVTAWKEVPDAVPWATPDDCVKAEEIAKADEGFQKALKERYGITNMDLVICDPWSIHAMPEDLKGLKVMQIFVYFKSFPDDNQYAHPADIMPFVDVILGKVIRIDMHDKVPAINKEDANYAGHLIPPEKMLKGLKPLDVIQPEGPSFDVKGNVVNWCKWSLHVGFNAREGLVLSDVSYDGRPVFYRFSFVEMSVPYADPREPYVRKCAFDIGDYGFGNTASSLTLGCDCLGAIHYFDGLLSNSKGEPKKVPKVVCMHEEDVGILWKHVEPRTGHSESRRSRRLVLSFVSTVVNYEYAFYIYLYLDGTFEVDIKLTGELSTNVLSPGEEEPEFGTLVLPNVNAQNHQHQFCVRIDPAIDDENGGKDVVVTEMNVEPMPPGPKNPYANAFYAKEQPLLSMWAAQRDVNPQSARYWKMTNPSKLNPITKKPVSYKLMPHASAPLMAHPNSVTAKKGYFSTKNLWVTPFSPDQRFPAGDFVFNEKTCHGLSEWTKKDKSLEGADPVVWYAFGVTHVVRIEEFPIMPVEHVGFALKPVNFFTANPSLDVPPGCNKASVLAGCQGCHAQNGVAQNGVAQNGHA